MKRIVFLFLVLCGVAATALAQDQTTQTRFEGQNITGIDVSGAWDIQITQGTSTKATLNFPARFENQLIFLLESDGKLKISFRGSVHTKGNEKFTAEIVCSSLNEIEMSGACKLKGNGKFSGNEVEFDLSGAAQADFENGIDAVYQLKIDMSGASKLTANITAPKYDLELSGASVLSLTGTAETAKLEASGASKVDLSKAVIRSIDLDISGASKTNLNVSGLISGEISGASKVVYTGEATTRVDVSGAASLKHN